MDLDFDLQLNDRQPDRVLVSVLLAPSGCDSIDIDGVELMLVCPDGEPLSHRMVLPISGTVSQSIVSTIELRGNGPLPVGTRVSATAWATCRQWEAHIPADPGTQIAAHCRGLVLVPLLGSHGFADRFIALSASERAALAASFSFLVPCQLPELKVVDDTSAAECREEDLHSFCCGLGLDEGEASWLEDLLNE